MRPHVVILFAAFLPLAAFAHHGGPAHDVGFDQHLGDRVPGQLMFVDDHARRVTLGAHLQGKPVLLVLGYLGCRDLCPMTLAGLTRALAASGMEPGRDYRAVFVSIDPEEDAAALALGKLERIPALERAAWTFLGGDAHSAGELARSVGFRYRSEPENTFAHPSGFVVLTPEGVLSRYFPGVRFDPLELKAAVAAASRGATGSVADRLLLLCSHFDPRHGRYSALVLDLLKAITGFFAIAAAVWAWRRSRARPES